MTDSTDEATTVESTVIAEAADLPAEGADSDRTPDVGTTDADDQDDENAETFPRAVVEKLRQENGKYRQRAQRADDLSRRLHTELVRATGRLADPSDLEYAEKHLDDPDTLTAAIEDLLARKPHLASRRPVGDIGQGQRGAHGEPFSLLSLLKQHA